MVGHTERNQTVENVVKRARKTDPKVELKCLRVIIQFLPRTDVFDCYCWWSNNLRMNVEWHLNCNCLAVNEKKCKDAWWFVYDGSSPTNVDKFELLKSLEWIPPLSPGFSLRKWNDGPLPIYSEWVCERGCDMLGFRTCQKKYWLSKWVIYKTVLNCS